MEDTLQPLLVILIGGLFAPILTQLIEKFLGAHHDEKNPASPSTPGTSKAKRKRWLKLFTYAVGIQLLLFTIFFFSSKWIYFDKNYFKTNERELIQEGIKKGKDYVIPKMTIRIYSEANNGVPLSDSLCSGKKINYCNLVTISYEIVALRNFKNEKIFSEYYESLYAAKALKEPGSEIESDDANPNDNICVYELVTTMGKYDRKTITTRSDFLYESLPATRKFFNKSYAGYKWDMFYYPNKEDDIIGEVEFQIISRTLKLAPPSSSDAIKKEANNREDPISPQLTISNGDCLNFNIITAKVPRLKNNETFGIKWSWN
jgi:hypothetical protein